MTTDRRAADLRADLALLAPANVADEARASYTAFRQQADQADDAALVALAREYAASGVPDPTLAMVLRPFFPPPCGVSDLSSPTTLATEPPYDTVANATLSAPPEVLGGLTLQLTVHSPCVLAAFVRASERAALPNRPSAFSGAEAAHPEDVTVWQRALGVRLRAGVRMPDAAATRHDCAATRHCRDSAGDFFVDPLFGRLSAAVVRVDGAPFPLHWKLGPEPLALAVRYEPGAIVGPATDLATVVAQLKVQREDIDAVALLRGLQAAKLRLSDLVEMSDSDWADLRREAKPPLPLGAVKALRGHLAQTGATGAMSGGLRPVSDVVAVHNIRLFIRHEAEQAGLPPEDVPSDLRHLPQLSKAAAETALRDARELFHGDDLLNQVSADFFAPYCMPRSPAALKVQRPDRGIMMYGPPGTGKSRINELLPEASGVLLLAPPMSAAEVRKPYVGESEKLIADYCRRGRLVPWLLCGWIVDETDSMAPKRNAGSGGGGDGDASKVAALLAVIGGSADVRNVVLFGATNRLEAMDDAVLRRTSAQFYAGLPNAASRAHFLQRLNESLAEVAVEPLSSTERELLVSMTVNFSGAALEKLVTRLYIALTAAPSAAPATPSRAAPSVSRHQAPAVEPSRRDCLLRAVTAVCRQMRVGLSGVLVPDLYREPPMVHPDLQQHLLAIAAGGNATQRVLFDATDAANVKQMVLTIEERGETGARAVALPLRPRCERCGTIACPRSGCPKHAGRNCSWYALPGFGGLGSDAMRERGAGVQEAVCDVRVVPHVLREVLLLSDALGIGTVWLLDKKHMVLKGCNDDTKVLDELQTVFAERMKAPSLVVVDVDSLAGVGLSTSEGSMGSTSYSITSPSVASAVLAEFDRAAMAPTADPQRRHWIVAVIRSDVMRKLFRQQVPGWPRTRRERERSAERKQKQPCTHCGQRYAEADNKPEACKYHPGKLQVQYAVGAEVVQEFCLGPLEPGFDGSRGALGLDPLAAPEDGAEPDAKKRNGAAGEEKPTYMWSCCGQRPGGANGCHSAKHTTKPLQRTPMAFQFSATRPEYADTLLADGSFVKLSREQKGRLLKCVSDKGKARGWFDHEQPMPLDRATFDAFVLPCANGSFPVGGDDATAKAATLLKAAGLGKIADGLQRATSPNVTVVEGRRRGSDAQTCTIEPDPCTGALVVRVNAPCTAGETLELRVVRGDAGHDEASLEVEADGGLALLPDLSQDGRLTVDRHADGQRLTVRSRGSNVLPSAKTLTFKAVDVSHCTFALSSL